MHVLPWKLLSQGIKPGDPVFGADAPVSISPKLLHLLIEAAVANQHFDERSYLAANPDVAEAVRAGKLRSGHEHFVTVGYYEGRGTGYAGFDEAWYLQRYPDVLLAVKRGENASGLEHFRGSGLREWRSPNKAAEADIARWRSVIDPAGSGDATVAAETPDEMVPPKVVAKAVLAMAAKAQTPARKRASAV
jgi:hypothetical protein